MAARTNSQFLFASLTEFISVWGQGGEASLNLTTRRGMANVQLNCTLGHPGSPYSFPPSSVPSPPPAPPPRRPRHRGPGELERNHLRAARYQAARTTGPVSSTPSSSTASTASVITPPLTPPVSEPSIVPASETATTASDVNSFNCDKCDFTSTTDHGVKIHMGHQHKNSQKPEEIRGETFNKSLNISFPIEERNENNSMSSSINNTVNNYIVKEDVSIVSLPKYKPGDEFRAPSDSCPGNALLSPPCQKCGKASKWNCSRVKQDRSWLHAYWCSSCSTQTCLTTPHII